MSTIRTEGPVVSRHGLDIYGIRNINTAYWNLPTPFLVEQAIQRREGRLAHLGPLVVRTGHHTGRSPNDKFVVREPSSEALVAWGDVNRPMAPDRFEALRRRLLTYFQAKDLFVQDRIAGADPSRSVPVRVVTETAWHSLFARNMLLAAPEGELAEHMPELTVLHAPGFFADPEVDGTHSEAFIALHLGLGLILIGGTAYAGEIKKAIFTALNYRLPREEVLTMHSAANVGEGEGGSVALFFGLSGTGKTTLSTDPTRLLIGDDEIGWSDGGVFNLEGGCYAKTIRLSPEDEPEIYETSRRFGTLLENVGLDASTGHLDLDDDSLTENTRAAYPLTYIPRVERSARGGHPSNIFMLTADAFGVLPPIARLTPAQALYYFLSGYTAKVAGTEQGITEPRATFSACFGAPFMVLSPIVYAELLGERIAQHDTRVWLVNTGWTGGAFGVGHRMKISHTRALIRAALDGSLEDATRPADPVFGLAVPRACPGIPSEVLDARSTWADEAAYDAQAKKLAGMFADNFRAFAGDVSAEVRASGPAAPPGGKAVVKAPPPALRPREATR